MAFAEVIRRQLSENKRQQSGLERFVLSNSRILKRLIEHEQRVEDQETELVELRERNKQLRKEVLVQGKNAGISADAAAAIDKKDRRIDQLQNEMMVMLKDKNKDSDTQVQLYREKALLEEHLAKKTSACEGFSQLISQQESIIERLKESTKSNEYALKNLEDEHKALHLEYSSCQAKLEETERELKNLLDRWKKEKQDMAEQMNQHNLANEAERLKRESELLMATAGQTEMVGLSSSYIDGGGPAVLPSKPHTKEEAHGAEIFACAFARDGSTFATGASDRIVKLWNSAGHFVNNLKGLSSTVTCLAFNAEGSSIAVGTEGSKIQIYAVGRTQGKTLQHVLNNHTDRVNSIAFCMASDILYSASKDHTVKSFDTKRGMVKETALSDSTCQSLCVLSPSQLVTAHFDKNIRMRDPRQELKTISFEFDSGHSRHITHITQHPDGVRILTAGKDSVLKEHDTRSQATAQTFTSPELSIGGSGTMPCYSPDGAYVACGSSNGSVIVWNTSDGSVERILKGGHTKDVTGCRWKSNGTELLSVAKDKHFILWG